MHENIFMPWSLRLNRFSLLLKLFAAKRHGQLKSNSCVPPIISLHIGEKSIFIKKSTENILKTTFHFEAQKGLRIVKKIEICRFIPTNTVYLHQYKG